MYQFFYKKVRERRKAMRKTIAEIAAAAGIDPGNLSRIETGERTPRVDTLTALANALKVSPTFFFGRVKPEVPE